MDDGCPHTVCAAGVDYVQSVQTCAAVSRLPGVRHVTLEEFEGSERVSPSAANGMWEQGHTVLQEDGAPQPLVTRTVEVPYDPDKYADAVSAVAPFVTGRDGREQPMISEVVRDWGPAGTAAAPLVRFTGPLPTVESVCHHIRAGS